MKPRRNWKKLERKRVDNYLAQQIEVASDPQEQQRLTDLYNQLGNVRELLNKQLVQASTEEEKNQVRMNVARHAPTCGISFRNNGIISIGKS